MAVYEQSRAMITSAFELLDHSLEDGSTNMKILASRMNRIISLRREVELKEKAAEVAKEEAAMSSLDILTKVEALKQAQQRLKATNDMHAREVYAQRAVLAKDIKELQLRVSGLFSAPLAVSDEMHRRLKKRLTKAVKEKELADKERIEKEALAQKALAFEENQMLKLVEESKRLEKKTVKNSKLQDLFEARESAVNILHGNVSDKYQDINLFIEHLDQPVSQLSGLLSSSQISADLDLKEQEGKMNGSFEVKSPPVVADITKVRHSVSNVDRVASSQTYAESVKNYVGENEKDAFQKKVKNKGKRRKKVKKDSICRRDTEDDLNGN